MKVTGIRAVLGVRSALEEAGLGRTSGYSGGETTGWIAANHYGSTGFSVKRVAGGDVAWHVVISGKPHLRYRKWTERQGDDDTIDLHEPVDPQSLAPRIRAAFESLGLEVRKVEYAGAQQHWDDDVDYEVVTDHPGWLGTPDTRNASQDGDGPLLKAMAVGPRASEIFPRMPGPLVGYVRGSQAYLTRESLMAVDARARQAEAERQSLMAGYGGEGSPGVPRWLREKGLEVSISEAGELRLKSPRLSDPCIPAETLANHWGDEVQGWKVPSYWLQPLAAFKPAVPFLLDGEMRDSVPFRVVDAQNGGDAPWLADEPTGPTPR